MEDCIHHMPYWKLFYHIIWGTKERQPIILPTFESALYRVIAAKFKELDGTTYAIGGIIDHEYLSNGSLITANDNFPESISFLPNLPEFVDEIVRSKNK